MMKIYFDSCCYSRWQDDMRVRRNAIEADAIRDIIAWRHDSDHTIIGSEMVAIELMDNSDTAARDADMEFFRGSIDQYVGIASADAARMQAFTAAGLGAKDSVHLAIAESVGADVLITVDKDFLRISNNRNLSVVKVVNPLNF